MRFSILYLVIIFPLLVRAQYISDINACIGIPDAVSNKEIRIYKSEGISNGTEIFRIYENGGHYSAELYHYYEKVPGYLNTIGFTNPAIYPNAELEYIYFRMIATQFKSLPDERYLKYKLEKTNVVCEDGIYALVTSKTSIVDGVTYTVLWKEKNESKTVVYNNPESYLEKFPDVDELLILKDLLTLVREQFSGLDTF